MDERTSDEGRVLHAVSSIVHLPFVPRIVHRPSFRLSSLVPRHCFIDLFLHQAVRTVHRAEKLHRASMFVFGLSYELCCVKDVSVEKIDLIAAQALNVLAANVAF